MVYKRTFKKPINTRGKLANRLLVTIKRVKSVTKYFHKRDITRCKIPSPPLSYFAHPHLTPSPKGLDIFIEWPHEELIRLFNCQRPQSDSVSTLVVE